MLTTSNTKKHKIRKKNIGLKRVESTQIRQEANVVEMMLRKNESEHPKVSIIERVIKISL